MGDTRGEALALPDRDLILAIARVERRGQGRGLGFHIGRRRQVDQPAPAAGVLERKDTADAPERRLPARARRLLARDGLGAAGYQVGPSFPAPRERRQGLDRA